MNSPPKTVLEGHDQALEEVNVIGLVIALAKHKKLIVTLPFLVAIVTAVVTFALPNLYQASAELMPPQQAQSGAAALLSQLGAVGGAAAGAAGLKNPNDVYIGMLQSRTLADRMVARFDLKKVYQTSSQERARTRLQASTAISVGKDGLISIQVEDTNKKLVAPLANGYVSELMRLTKVLAVSEAGQRRLFYESQLEQAKDNLAKAETALKAGLDSHGVINVDAESAAVSATAARLRAQISAKEIERNSMSAFVTEQNPQYKRVNQDLDSLRAELSKLENGQSVGTIGNTSGKTSEQRGFENIKLLRDVKYYQMLYDLLAKQYEVARLDEAKDPSVIQVLDPAIEPEQKFKPHRTLIVAIFAMLSLFVACCWALAVEAHRKLLRTPTGASQWHELKSQLALK